MVLETSEITLSPGVTQTVPPLAACASENALRSEPAPLSASETTLKCELSAEAHGAVDADAGLAEFTTVDETANIAPNRANTKLTDRALRMRRT